MCAFFFLITSAFGSVLIIQVQKQPFQQSFRVWEIIDTNRGSGPENINDGSVLFKCPIKPWQWASMHNTRTLKPKQLNVTLFILLFIPVPFLLWHVKVSSVKRKNPLTAPEKSVKGLMVKVAECYLHKCGNVFALFWFPCWSLVLLHCH